MMTDLAVSNSNFYRKYLIYTRFGVGTSYFVFHSYQASDVRYSLTTSIDSVCCR